MSFSSRLAQSRPLELAGLTYKVAPLTLKDFAEIEDWLDSLVQSELVSPISLFSHEGLSLLLHRLSGQELLLRLTLRRDQPHITHVEIRRLLQSLYDLGTSEAILAIGRVFAIAMETDVPKS